MNEDSDLQAELVRLAREKPPPYTKETFSSDFSEFQAIFSARQVIAHYYSQVIGDCPKLGKLDAVALARLVRGEIEIRKTATIAGAAMTGNLLLASIFLMLSESEPAYLSGSVFLIFIQWRLWVYFIRKDSEVRAARELFFVVRAIEKYAKYWNEPGFRKMVAEHLEHAAVLIGSIPSTIAGIAPAVRSDLFAAGKKKTQAFRALELAVIKGDPDACSNLTDRLLENLALLLSGQWYDLPESDYKHTVSRRTMTAWISSAALFIIAAIAIIAFFPRLAFTASILSTVISIMIAFAGWFLKNNGVSMDLLEQYADISEKLTRRDG